MVPILPDQAIRGDRPIDDLAGRIQCDSDACHFAALHAGVNSVTNTALRSMRQATIQTEKLGVTDVS